jgi:hypothetical protein
MCARLSLRTRIIRLASDLAMDLLISAQGGLWSARYRLVHLSPVV